MDPKANRSDPEKPAAESKSRGLPPNSLAGNKKNCHNLYKLRVTALDSAARIMFPL